MKWRGPIVVLVLLAVGAAAGYGASLASAGQPGADGVPRPVTAQAPEYPLNPPPSIRPDPGIAPLATDLPLRKGHVGSGAFKVTFPVPRGWDETPNSPNETKFHKLDNPSYTYVLRVENVISQRESIERALTRRIADLEEQEEQVEVVSETEDYLHFTYLADGYLRHGLVQWVDMSGGGFAEVEVAATGREVDVPGMQDLVARVVAGLERG